MKDDFITKSEEKYELNQLQIFALHKYYQALMNKAGSKEWQLLKHEAHRVLLFIQKNTFQ